MLRQHPECVTYFGHLAHDIRVDHRIRAAIAQQWTGTAVPRTFQRIS
ncbi:hypothetical protein [Streptomyces sp. NPDC007883]